MDAAEDDRLSRLPDDLLHSILRDLQLKHAARTSALSRRWASQWLRALASSPVIDFTDRDFARGQPPARAAATVARCLRLHDECGAPLDAFRVALMSPSGSGDGAFERDVVGCVAAAVARGAREVEVNLTPSQEDAAPHADHGSAAFLELPGDLFQARNSLQRLALGRFSLRAVALPAAGLAGLRSLSLSHTDVTDEAVRGMLATCGALELLSLRSCPLLTSLSIAGERLRALELVGCQAVRELRVAAPALESFALYGHVDVSVTDYYADAVDVDLGATPALRDAYLSHLGCGDPNAHDFAYPFLDYVAHARILTLCSVGLLLIYEQQSYDEVAYCDMTNLQELQLLMASLDDGDLTHVTTFFMLTQLPLLDRLFVRLPGDPAHGSGSASAAALTGEDDDDADIVLEYEIVLDHLAFVKVVNFRGTRRELRLLKFFLKRAPVLEQLVLVTAVEEEGTPGDKQLKLKVIQGRVSALQKASPEVRVSVCRPGEDDSPNHAHTRFYHEEQRCMRASGMI